MLSNVKKDKKFKINLFFFFLFIVIAGITFYPLDQPQGTLPKAQTVGCGSPGDQGNNMGVGRYCTQGGGECQGTQSPYCSVDVLQGVPSFCSKQCTTDAECGTGATCQGSGLERGCVPTACGAVTQPSMAAAQPSTDGAAQAGCGNPGDQGNSQGVGRYCTQGGGECQGTQSQYCSVDFQQGVPAICSKPCSTNADCGENAICSGSGLERGCEPVACGTAGGSGGNQSGGGVIPGGGTLGGSLPPLGDLGGVLGGGGGGNGLLSLIMGVISGGGLPAGGGGNNCDVFDQLLQFIGLGSCSDNDDNDDSDDNDNDDEDDNDNSGLLELITGGFQNLF